MIEQDFKSWMQAITIEYTEIIKYYNNIKYIISYNYIIRIYYIHNYNDGIVIYDLYIVMYI